MTRSHKTALIVFVVALIVYLLSMSNIFNGDGLGYARLVETADFDRLCSVSARLLFCPSGKVLHEVAHFIGFPIRSVRSLQALNAIFGAAGVAIFFLAAYLISRSRWMSLVAALGFGGSLAYWFWSTNATSYPGNICFLVLTLYLLLKLAQARSHDGIAGSAVWIGVAHAFAGFYWLTAILLVPAVTMSILIVSDRAEFRLRAKAAAAYILSFGACLFVPLFAAGLITGRVSSLSDFPAWLTAASYGIPPDLSLLNFSRGVIGFSSSVFRLVDLGPLVKSTVWGVPFVEQSRAGVYAELGVIAALWATISVMTVAFAICRKRIMREHPRQVIILLLWVALPAVFGLVWLGSDTERWLAVLPAMWLLMVVVVTDVNGKRFPSSPRWVRTLFAVFAFATVSYNAAFSVLPDEDIDNNEYLKAARILDLRMSENDLVLLWGHDHEFTGEHLAYFHGKQASHVAQVLRETGKQTFNVLQSSIDEARSHGGRIFLMGRLFVDGGPGKSEIESINVDVSREQFQDFFSRGTRRVAFSLGNDSFWELIGEP